MRGSVEMAAIHGKMSDVAKANEMYITVTLHEDARWRIGLWFMRLGAWIMGAGFGVEEEK